jgi:hypothetical protein
MISFEENFQMKVRSVFWQFLQFLAILEKEELPGVKALTKKLEGIYYYYYYYYYYY